jgi:hypothetical protein
MTQPKLKFPFRADGSVPHFPKEWEEKYEWKAAEPFKAKLTLEDMARGRSAAYFIFKSESGATFTVFMTDLVTMIRDRRWKEGAIAAVFEPCKRGENYGIRLAAAK